MHLTTSLCPQVYRNDSDKGERPPVKPAKEFHLIWRQNGRSPVTMWEPLPPQGYRAIGTILVPDAEQPGSSEVLCVREDLCTQTRTFDSPVWKFEPSVVQVEPFALFDETLDFMTAYRCWALASRCPLWLQACPCSQFLLLIVLLAVLGTAQLAGK